MGELGCGGGVQDGVLSQRRGGGAVLVRPGTLYTAPRRTASHPAARAPLTRPSSVGGERLVRNKDTGEK